MRGLCTSFGMEASRVSVRMGAADGCCCGLRARLRGSALAPAPVLHLDKDLCLQKEWEWAPAQGRCGARRSSAERDPDWHMPVGDEGHAKVTLSADAGAWQNKWTHKKESHNTHQ